MHANKSLLHLWAKMVAGQSVSCLLRKDKDKNNSSKNKGKKDQAKDEYEISAERDSLTLYSSTML